jgi:hypothetical protein
MPACYIAAAATAESTTELVAGSARRRRGARYAQTRPDTQVLTIEEVNFE